MAQSKHDIKMILEQAGIRPRRRFGQNFMIDQNLVRLVAEAGRIGAQDVVIEVGPGTGTLTEELLLRGGQVIAVEIDRDLASVLRAKFAANEKLTLIEADALSGKHELNEQLMRSIATARRTGRAAKLVANLPYNIASPLIIELLLAGVELLAFTVQKEVADRLRAMPGTDAYGALSVMAQLLARIEMLRTLAPQSFWPAPKVQSALVRMTRDDRLGDRAREFSLFLQRAFAARRKTLRNALVHWGFDVGGVLDALGIDPQVRGENLWAAQWLALFDALRSQREA